MTRPQDAAWWEVMTVGLLEVELFLPEASSLKDRRSVVKSLKDQLRARFNVAVAELDQHLKWQRACLGITTVGNDRPYVDGCLQEVVRWIEGHPLLELVRVEREVL